MHKFLAFILTVGGSFLIMSSVTFAQPADTTATDTTPIVIEHNPLPLGTTCWPGLKCSIVITAVSATAPRG